MSDQQTIELRYSPWQMLKLVALGIGMTCLSGVATQVANPIGILKPVSYFGVVFFGATSIIILVRLVRDWNKVVVRLTDSGLTDKRLAPEEIPWRGIASVDFHDVAKQRFLVLNVDPTTEATLSLTRTVRWSRAANAKLGIDGLATTTQGLDLSAESLIELCRARLQSAQ